MTQALSSSGPRVATALRQRQSGLALLTVMFIFAIVAVLATSMIERQGLDVNRSANYFNSIQAYHHVKALESAARELLHQDYQDDADRLPDYYSTLGTEELWSRENQAAEPFPFRFRLIDMQGLFNLNNLSPDAGAVAKYEERFRILLSHLGLSTSYARVLVDWMTPNSGADNDYLDNNPGYLAAYQQLSHISELLLLENMSFEDYEKLLPYVTVLPVNGAPTKLNVNTAPAAVLTAIHASIGSSGGDKLRVPGPTDVYDQVSDFTATDEITEARRQNNQTGEQQGGNENPSVLMAEEGENSNAANQNSGGADDDSGADDNSGSSSGSGGAGSGSTGSTVTNTVLDDDFGVKSSYFLLSADLNYQERSVKLTSLMHLDRNTGAIRVLSRDFTQDYIILDTANPQELKVGINAN